MNLTLELFLVALVHSLAVRNIVQIIVHILLVQYAICPGTSMWSVIMQIQRSMDSRVDLEALVSYVDSLDGQCS